MIKFEIKKILFILIIMSKHKNKSRASYRMPPGTVQFIGTRRMESPRLELVEYNSRDARSREIASAAECCAFSEGHISWLAVKGLHEVGVIEKIGDQLGVHPLILEDIANTEHYPKIEFFDRYIYTELKQLFFDRATLELATEQASFLLGANYVVSFLESDSGIFSEVKDRILNKKTKIGSRGADYLNYSLIDAVIDNYFIVTDEIGEELESLEEEIVESPTPGSLKRLHSLRRSLIQIRKAVAPLREVVRKFEILETELISEQSNLYYRDLYDHTVQILESVETYRDIMSALLDVYLSSTSNKLNSVMKVLTVISTIFIPLTFIAGVYGMNFRAMPELDWDYGYAFAWGIMLMVAIGMLANFKRKRWF